MNQPSFSATEPSATELATHVALAARAGHFDELRGHALGPDGPREMTASWETFFHQAGAHDLEDFQRRKTSLDRQIRDNGVSYNVYADKDQPQRPWSLDLFPLILESATWRQIEAGVLQRVRLLDRVLADVYGPQTTLRQGLLPTALVQGHPGYLRGLHGVQPAGGNHLQIAAFDLARGPDGEWAVVAQRTQAPSGLGYALENRVSISRLFPSAFEALHIQRLAASYRAWIDGLRAMAPAGPASHIALLTPGPYNETYFEHAYLARYLGITLVQGSDLTVRDDHLYLRTLRGLEPVHALIKRVDDAWCDPLELRADSSLGVPGLLQTLRSGHLLMANLPGSAFLESPALLGFLPGLAQAVLGEDLFLPSVPTWWCGERSALQEAQADFGQCHLMPTYPSSTLHPPFAGLDCASLSPAESRAWREQLESAGENFTLQRHWPQSQLPTWEGGQAPQRIVPRDVLLRVFALSDGPQSWRLLPGGLTRIVRPQDGQTSMQRGGSSADTWVRIDPQSGDTVDRTTLLERTATPIPLSTQRRVITSRAAENLFWMGRYTERSENSLRLARLTLSTLVSSEQSCLPLLKWLGEMAQTCGLVDANTPSPNLSRRIFMRALVSGLGQPEATPSVGYNLRALRQVASSIRERFSQAHWQLIEGTEAAFLQGCADTARDEHVAPVDVLRLLDTVSPQLAAMTGEQTDRMTRDDGWRLLSVGRQIERLDFLATALARALDAGVVHEPAGFEALLALFDSTITFHAQYQHSRDVAALLDLLVMSRENPRALGWVSQTLRGRLLKLAGNEDDPLAEQVPNPDGWSLPALCQDLRPLPALGALLDDCARAAWRISDGISLRYFTHTHEAARSLGA